MTKTAPHTTYHIPHSPRGFTLLEVIIAISVISLVLTAAAGLTRTSLIQGRFSMNYLGALAQAEEGLEVVRHLRDSNWLQNKPWRNGLNDGTYVITETPDSRYERWSLHPSNGEENVQIEISTNDDALRATSHVQYRDGPQNKSVDLTEELTDWKKGPL